VFQDPWSSLNPRMRVRDLVAEPLVVNQRVDRREVDRQVAKVLEDVGLRPEQARNFPHEFSGGQRQRIAIASALISNPRLIVLDEPVSALDVSIRSQIMNLFKDLQAEYRVGYLLVAHDLGTTRYMADEIAVMYLGKIVEMAPTETLFAEPKHPYTRALFSAALPSHPDSPHEEIVLEGEIPSPIDPPSGCSFHPRCPQKIGAICEQVQPGLLACGRPGHQVACHLYPGDQHRAPGASMATAGNGPAADPGTSPPTAARKIVDSSSTMKSGT
jgi:oligopeptide/dipeptide ABC transporter ATP-binding protein